jgi:transposase
MVTGRPKAQLVLDEAERAQLASMARSRSLSAALVLRARIVLACELEPSNRKVAQRLQVNAATVGKWRRRFVEQRIAGLHDELRSGAPRSIDDERIAMLINTTLKTKPADGSTHWSTRTLAENTGISKSAVQRFLSLFAVQPHRAENFKLSTDTLFIEKLRDVVGLYLNPPDNALVLCVDEKSQCQALERTQPMLPLGLGYAEGVTHDYKRHGTTTLFAALNVLNGTILASCKPRHRHQEFLSFLREIDQALPAQLDIHCIVDNYGTHKHPKVKAWLAARARWHLHFIPTYSSWLNQVERFFATITERAIRRGSFASVKQLVQKSITSSLTTTRTASHLSGLPRLIQSSPSSKDFASESLGQHTREALNKSRAVRPSDFRPGQDGEDAV